LKLDTWDVGEYVVTDDIIADDMKEAMESMCGLISSQSSSGIWRYVRDGSGAEGVVHMFRTCVISDGISSAVFGKRDR